MKGILLAGGSGTRLMPMTKTISKQILPIYDKPMIFYPLSTLMRAGIKDILIISTPRDLPAIMNLLGDGSSLGISISYKEQPSPDGIAQAFTIGADFIGKSNVCLILGDNIYYGRGLVQSLEKASNLKDGGYIFGYHVRDPERYGVVDFDDEKNVISVEEKPKNPKTNWAVTGLYFYDNDVIEIAKNLKPSARGELEITDVNKAYLKKKKLKIEFFGRGIAWLDTGTPESLLKAANFIQNVEERQGLKIGCIEEIAFHKEFIDKEQLLKLAANYGSSDYGKYLKEIAKEGRSSFWLT